MAITIDEYFTFKCYRPNYTGIDYQESMGFVKNVESQAHFCFEDCQEQKRELVIQTFVVRTSRFEKTHQMQIIEYRHESDTLTPVALLDPHFNQVCMGTILGVSYHGDILDVVTCEKYNARNYRLKVSDSFALRRNYSVRVYEEEYAALIGSKYDALTGLLTIIQLKTEFREVSLRLVQINMKEEDHRQNDRVEIKVEKVTFGLCQETYGYQPVFALPELDCVVLKSKPADKGLMALRFLFFIPSTEKTEIHESKIMVSKNTCFFGRKDTLTIIDRDTNLASVFRIRRGSNPEIIHNFDLGWLNANVFAIFQSGGAAIDTFQIYEDWYLLSITDKDRKFGSYSLVNLRKKVFQVLAGDIRNMTHDIENCGWEQFRSGLTQMDPFQNIPTLRLPVVQAKEDKKQAGEDNLHNLRGDNLKTTHLMTLHEIIFQQE